jgi:hypothetical protein
MTKTQNVDTYNLGVDITDSCSTVFSTEDGTFRQAIVMGSDATTVGTIFGVARSNNAGVSWDPLFAVCQNGCIGIGTTAPTSQLHIIGNLTISGLVDL